MLDQYLLKGAADACACFNTKLADINGVPTTPTPKLPVGLLGKAEAFGRGQLDAGKALFHNLRGGLGGQYSPEFQGNLAGVPEAGAFNRAAHRQMAMGNLKTLAPSLLAGGGLYMLHRHHQRQKELEQQQAMQQQAGGYPMM